MLSLTLANAGSISAADESPEWHFQSPGGLRRIVQVEGKKWQLHFPNGATNELTELSRTTEFVELKNLKNTNILRIFKGHAESQKGGTGDFRRFTTGKWAKPLTAAPGRDDYKIRVVYFVPSDRKPVREYEAKIHNVLELIAEIITLDLRKKGYETKGPQFMLNDQGNIDVQLLVGENSTRAYNHLPALKSPDHPQDIFAEVDRRLGDPNKNLTFIFAETYEESAAKQLWPGHVAIAAARPPSGGIGVFSAWILKDEFCTADPAMLRKFFFDETPFRGRKAIGHKGPNSPRSEFMEDGIGGALHELAHAFGPTHHGRGSGGSRNFMGQGFRNLRWNCGLKTNSRLAGTFSKENGWMLMTSRYLNPKVNRNDNERPQMDVQFARKGTHLAVNVTATDDSELSLLTLVEVTKNDGRQIIEAKKLSGASQKVRFRLRRSQVSQTKPTLQLILVDAGGNHRKVSKTP